MITKREYTEAADRAVKMLEQAGIVLTKKEAADIEVADFGLGDLDSIGLQLVVYVNTPRVCAKEIVLFPWQTCPEHRHPNIGGRPGKEETFRCRAGLCYLYVDKEPNSEPRRQNLGKYADYLNAAHEVVLRPGEQYTLAPDTPHWFRGGPEGAVVSEFSTNSTDENDIFTDPRIQRTPIVGE